MEQSRMLFVLQGKWGHFQDLIQVVRMEGKHSCKCQNTLMDRRDTEMNTCRLKEVCMQCSVHLELCMKLKCEELFKNDNIQSQVEQRCTWRQVNLNALHCYFTFMIHWPAGRSSTNVKTRSQCTYTDTNVENVLCKSSQIACVSKMMLQCTVIH